MTDDAPWLSTGWRLGGVIRREGTYLPAGANVKRRHNELTLSASAKTEVARVASPWMWLSLVMVVPSAVGFCRAARVCRENWFTRDARDLAGPASKALHRTRSWLERVGHWFATVGFWPGLASPLPVSLSLHFLHGDLFTCDDQTGCRYGASLTSLWPILWGFHVLPMGV
jgi:hypothetical protein